MAETNELPHPTRRNLLWLSIQILLRMLFVACFRYRCRGLRNVPEEGGALLLVNHQSFLDPMLVGLPLRRPVSFLARDSLFPIPVIGWILRNTYVMPINREAASSRSIKDAVARMRQGFLVGIFPEGTRSRDAQVGEFKPGFIALVRRGNVPVYPVGIAGAGRAFPRGSLWFRPQQVCVVYGEALAADDLALLDSRGREQEFLSVAHQRVSECQREAEAWARSLPLSAFEPRPPDDEAEPAPRLRSIS